MKYVCSINTEKRKLMKIQNSSEKEVQGLVKIFLPYTKTNLKYKRKTIGNSLMNLHNLYAMLNEY